MVLSDCTCDEIVSWECHNTYHSCNDCSGYLIITQAQREDCSICKMPEKKFETKDSGERIEYDSGMRRDIQSGKPRPDLLFIDGLPYDQQPLIRWASLLQRGAEKYGEKNWTLANSKEELARFRASAIRHFFQWASGEVDEDHMAATFFNMSAVAYMEYKLNAQNNQD